MSPSPESVLSGLYGRCATCGAPLGPRVGRSTDGRVRVFVGCRDDDDHPSV
ncbi:hypothetical protein [Nocardioides sp.]|uniref:hypothetical protein n=1 Tax=Nocardioides sp. TaxID=35761 RepID=UPI0027163199|nr:hypothetical protein [Nocardioides sp.]MDO9457395.1 hypothetical protein [Nocardioides sp.]